MRRPHFKIAQFHSKPNIPPDMHANSQPADELDICPLPLAAEIKRPMNNQVPVSDGLMDEIRRRLNEGAYLTRNAAETTASRMIDNDDL